jgi:hypothetical protein
MGIFTFKYFLHLAHCKNKMTEYHKYYNVACTIPIYQVIYLKFVPTICIYNSFKNLSTMFLYKLTIFAYGVSTNFHNVVCNVHTLSRYF